MLDKYLFHDIIIKLSDSNDQLGGIAQLGERLNGIQEVAGSIPTISRKEKTFCFTAKGFFFSAISKNPLAVVADSGVQYSLQYESEDKTLKTDNHKAQ